MLGCEEDAVDAVDVVTVVIVAVEVAIFQHKSYINRHNVSDRGC